MNDITSILSAIENGDPKAVEGLLPLVYDELRKLAAQRLALEKPGQTLQATALVHEAYLRLVGGDQRQDWNGRAHFFGAASRAMRQVLVDFARRRRAEKHGGGATRVSLSDGDAALEIELDEILTLDAALERLHAVDERLRQIVELRFFGGFSEREVAELLGVTPRTIERNWLKARLFLLRELKPRDPPTNESG